MQFRLTRRGEVTRNDEELRRLHQSLILTPAIQTRFSVRKHRMDLDV